VSLLLSQEYIFISSNGATAGVMDFLQLVDVPETLFTAVLPLAD